MATGAEVVRLRVEASEVPRFPPTRALAYRKSMRLPYCCACAALLATGCPGDDGGSTTAAEPTTSATVGSSGTSGSGPADSTTASAPTTDNDTTAGCELGTLDCACRPDQSCDDDLVCDVGTCQLPSDDSTTAGDSSTTSSEAECGNGMAEPGELCFGAATPFAMGAGTIAVVVANFDADPAPDIVAANRDANTVSIRLGDGLGGFGVQSPFGVGAGPIAIGAGDFDNDAQLDIVTANSADMTVVAGTGTGDFGAPTAYALAPDLTPVTPTDLVVEDLDGNLAPDVLLTESQSQSVIIFRAEKGAFLPRQSFVTGAGPAAIHMADLSGDGVADALTADATGNTVSLLLGNGLGQIGEPTSQSAGTNPLGVAAADFNGDGNVDAIVANPAGLTIRLGNGLGGFGGQVPLPIAGGPQALLATDLDLDGITDVAIATGDGMVHVLLGTGASMLTEAATIPVGMNPQDIVAADLNDDGLLDLVTANLGSGGVSVILTDA